MMKTKEIKIIKDQDTTEFGNLKEGQKLTLPTKKAELLINRGIGKNQLSNRALGASNRGNDD